MDVEAIFSLAAATSLKGLSATNSNRPERRSGAQTVERALSLLMQVAIAGSSGLRLTDLASRAGLDISTTHRLLATMIRYGFVEQEARSRRYYLGLEFFSVAAAASTRLDRNAAVRDTLKRLQGRTGATTHFMMRSGHDLVCVDIVKARGAPARHALGARRPIGLGAPGIAVLAAFPDAEGEDLIIHNIRRISRDPEQAIIAVRNAMLAARFNGFAHEDNPVDGTSHFAVAVLKSDGRPEGALSLAARRQTDPQTGEAGLLEALFLEAQGLRQSLFQLSPDVQDLNTGLPQSAA